MSSDEFMRACDTGDEARIGDLLAADPALAHARDDQGRTGLHRAVRHPEALRVLLRHGADPDARESGDNVAALHLAAANGLLESVNVLLEAGADVHGEGDLHEGGVIGWASGSHDAALIQRLVESGARHHIFSAMAMRDYDLVRRVAAEEPGALTRRRSRFENHHTAVHAAFAAPDGVGHLTGMPDHAMLALLVELGADVDALDDRGRTPLALAMLRGDREAMRILAAAGATAPHEDGMADIAQLMPTLSGAAARIEPLFSAADMRATVRWYEALGFTMVDGYEEEDALLFARLAYGRSGFGLTPGTPPASGVSLWITTSSVQSLYDLVRARQLHAARQVLSGAADTMQFPFEEDLYSPFYGGLQFSIRDPNGLSVVFYQPE